MHLKRSPDSTPGTRIAPLQKPWRSHAGDAPLAELAPREGPPVIDLKPSRSLGLRDRSWSRDRSHMPVYIAFVVHTAIFVLGTRLFSHNSAILTATRFLHT